MLYVYIINSVIYPGTRLILGSVSVWFGYINIRTVQIFEGLGLVPVSVPIRFFGSDFFCPCLFALNKY